MYSPFVYYSADDFGMTPATCARIADCSKNGCLGKISILPNTTVENLSQYLTGTAVIAVHLNFVEGRCVSDPGDVPLLVDAEGSFCHSFFELLTLSLSKKRKAFFSQMQKEIRAQLAAARAFLPKGAPLYLDSHQHTHMIPLIFRALAAVIEEDALAVAFLRIPAEPITPFLLTPSLYPGYFSVNLIKQWVLKFCNLCNRAVFRRLNIPTADFFGILFSGHMTKARVEKLLPHYYRRARRRHRNIEVLFHPGYTEAGEALFDEKKTSFLPFYFSNGRKEEFDALHELKN